MSNIAQRICVFGLSLFALAGLALAQTTTTPVVSPGFRTSGMVGLTAGQTARLNVLNPGLQVPAATGAACPALLSFLNDQGVVITTATVSVMPGKSAFLDLDRDTAISTTDLRVEIRAAIAIPEAAPTACRFIPTMEVFNNNTGATQFVVGHFAKLPAPTPSPASTTP
jgi:hypothetical protein